MSAYRKLQREYVDLVGRLVENADRPAVSPRRRPGGAAGQRQRRRRRGHGRTVGAAGVGLYRTEYLFLTHPSVPDEEEQYQAYRAVIESAPNRTVTIRTIDLGADKPVPYFGREGETNPFMGFRSIRLSYAYPEFFRTQLRAILRAGVQARWSCCSRWSARWRRCATSGGWWRRRGRNCANAGVPFGEDVPLGVMIEVPAAALCIEEIVREVDFVSIGSNDLIQYLMAADRDNPKVALPVRAVQPGAAAAAEPGDPGLQRPRQAGDAVRRDGRPARAACLPLFGMGLRRMSMSPAFLPTIREVLRHTTLAAAKEAARCVLGMATVQEVRSYLTAKVREIWPEYDACWTCGSDEG